MDQDQRSPTQADTVEVYADASGSWRWHRQAPNGEIISTSGESYTREHDARKAARRANPDALVLLGGSRVIGLHEL